MTYLFTAIWFPPGGSGRQSGTIIGNRQLRVKGETIQKHRIYKMENKQKNIIKPKPSN
jgi:hypothetical protein